MKKYIIIALYLVLCASPSHAMWAIGATGGSVSSAVSCGSGTNEISNTPLTTSVLGIPASWGGQSFQPTTNGMTLYSITLRFSAVTNGTINITMRFGTNINLSGTCGTGNNCLKEVTKQVTVSDIDQSVEFVFQDTTSLSSSSTYYIAVHGDTAGGAVGWYFGAGDTMTGLPYSTSSTFDWDLTGHNDTSDLDLVIKRCN